MSRARFACEACGKDLGHDRRCAGCNVVRYCDRECQRAHWRQHKPFCSQWRASPASAQERAPKPSEIPVPATTELNPPDNITDNGYIIRVKPKGDKPVLDDIAGQIDAWHFDPLGDETKERTQIMHREGWSNVIEAGKFYDHSGTDAWYYYVYGPSNAFSKGSGKPKNEVASLVCYDSVYGDVIVVASGPLETGWPEVIKKSELVKTVEWYKTNDRELVFQERERSRFMRKLGLAEMDSASGLPAHIFHSRRM
jgi:MYND finger